MRALFVVVFAFLAQAANAEIVDEKHLEQALLNLPGVQLTQEVASDLVAITISAASPDLDPHLLLAQLYIESRFNPTATSRLIDGKRHTGARASRKAPIGWSGVLYCGMAQTAAVTWSACLGLRDPQAAINAQVAELRTWLRMTRGDLVRSLAGFGCGNFGARTGRCNRYPQRVQALAKRLRYSTSVVPLR